MKSWKKLIKRLKVGDLVKIVWFDAESTDEWHEAAEDFCDHLTVCETVGFLQKIEERFVTIYSTGTFECGSDETDNFCLTMKIPAGCVSAVFRIPDKHVKIFEA